ncbi:unnamed protein product [Caenorhabditis bovis]|uniref:Uncharacterized protein n=1 Tax=Caenorhabditis bovis TaxID=2654633 RepID=A0A8S1EGC6_9PELO|nr:unnamed protein product [Caenorhabditis bovis]
MVNDIPIANTQFNFDAGLNRSNENVASQSAFTKYDEDEDETDDDTKRRQANYKKMMQDYAILKVPNPFVSDEINRAVAAEKKRNRALLASMDLSNKATIQNLAMDSFSVPNMNPDSTTATHQYSGSTPNLYSRAQTDPISGMVTYQNSAPIINQNSDNIMNSNTGSMMFPNSCLASIAHSSGDMNPNAGAGLYTNSGGTPITYSGDLLNLTTCALMGPNSGSVPISYSGGVMNQNTGPLMHPNTCAVPTPYSNGVMNPNPMFGMPPVTPHSMAAANISYQSLFQNPISGQPMNFPIWPQMTMQQAPGKAPRAPRFAETQNQPRLKKPAGPKRPKPTATPAAPQMSANFAPPFMPYQMPGNMANGFPNMTGQMQQNRAYPAAQFPYGPINAIPGVDMQFLKQWHDLQKSFVDQFNFFNGAWPTMMPKKQ